MARKDPVVDEEKHAANMARLKELAEWYLTPEGREEMESKSADHVTVLHGFIVEILHMVEEGHGRNATGPAVYFGTLRYKGECGFGHGCEHPIDTYLNALTAVWDGEVAGKKRRRVKPSDARPANCRFRLKDEGKSYPKSGCVACGKTIMTGLGMGECAEKAEVP